MQQSADLCPAIAPALKYFLLRSDLAQKAYGYLTDKEQYNFFQMSSAGGWGMGGRAEENNTAPPIILYFSSPSVCFSPPLHPPGRSLGKAAYAPCHVLGM